MTETDPVLLVMRRRIVLRAVGCAALAFLAACALYAPWHGTADRGIGDALGCMFVHGGCPFSDSAPSYTDHRGVDDVDTWPALVLFALASLATYAALTASRRAQKGAGVCAIIVPLLLGPYIVFATAMAHLLTGTVSRGGDVGFYIMLLATFVIGIINVRDPRPRPPAVELPRATARVHV